MTDDYYSAPALSKQPQGIAPGIYYDLPVEEYHADPALSSSGLKKLLKNPMEYWDSSPLNPDREPLDTVALKNGKAFHTMLLEPHKFNEEFVIKQGCKSSSIKGTIGEGDYKDMVNAVDVIKRHPLFSNLCNGGKTEVSIFWRDKETGIMCRVRFDYLHPNWGLDYKTTTDVEKEKLTYAIADYGYDISAAMYLEGLRKGHEMGVYEYDPKNHFGFVLLFQVKKRPYLPRAFRLHEGLLTIGHSQFRRGLQLYKENIEQYGTAPWSAGYDGVEDLLLEEMPYRYRQ